MVPQTRESSSLELIVSRFEDLLRTMADSGGALQMESVVRFATVAISGAEHAAITLQRAGREPRTVFATGELPEQVDALQYSLDEGPCVAALTESDLVSVGDLASDDQFPRFSPAAAQLGIRSMLATRLYLTRQDRAALNLYAARPNAFTPDQLPVAAIFASYASLVLLNELRDDQITNLERALKSNREISVAIGILMATGRASHDEALQQLLDASQHLNRRLRDIAEEVRRTGQLPGRRAHKSP